MCMTYSCHISTMVFNRLVYQDRCVWNSLITECIKGGKARDALALYKKMLVENCTLFLDGSTYVCLLKACAMLKDLDMGVQIHQSISTTGLLEKDMFIGSSLVNMYAKCNSLAKAQEVFDALPTRNIVSWTALMAGYREYGQSEEALHCFVRMEEEGLCPNTFTYVCTLKACSCIRAADKCTRLHLDIVKKGWEREELLGNTLVDTYAKCGSLASAQKVFDELPCQDVVSWTALIAGYVEYENADEVLSFSERMHDEGISFNSFTFVCFLKACASIGVVSKGQEIHAHICRMGLESELLVGSALVNMYAKCALLTEAQHVFDKLRVRDSVLWTTLIGGYVEHGHGEEAIGLFKKMQIEGYPVNAVTLMCGLKACGNIRATIAGQELHTEIIKKGFEGEPFITNTLVDMYVEFALLATAEDLLDKLPARDIVAWNALLAGYVEHGLDETALRLFARMQVNGIPLNASSLVCGLKVCGRLGDAVTGHDIHMKVLRIGLERELVVGSTLVDMYMKCGVFAEAHEVFGRLPSRDVVAWTVLITGYIDHGHGKEALHVFERMQHYGVCLNAIAFVCSLKACSCDGAIGKGREIHAAIVKRGLERELFVGNTLVDMYTKCGMLAEAREVFETLPNHDMIAGTALIAGYVDHGYGEEALHCLEKLQHEGTPLNSVAIGCSLRVCGQLGALFKGQCMHDELVRKGFEGEVMVGITLVDTYAKCASTREAQYTFDELTTRDVILWNALIAGYAQVVETDTVVHVLEMMIHEGIRPNAATFASVLNTCSDAGLVDMGEMILEVMSNEYGVNATPDHYGCVVDLLGRVGQIDKAVALIEDMPFHPCAVLWHTVLGACRKIGNLELGKLAFEHAASLDQKSIAAYVCMCNIYADTALEVVGSVVGN